MENNIINILKEHIVDWLVSYNNSGEINQIQKIDEITLYHNSVMVNGPIIHFRPVNVLIERNNINCEYLLCDLKNIGFYTNEYFENEIGNIMLRYLKFSNI